MAQIAALREILDRAWGKPLPADAQANEADAAHPQSGVVRVPSQCQTAEEWQKEADAWGKDRRSVEDPIAAFNASHPDPKGRVN